MRHIPATFLPPIALEPRSKTPMYRQLYDWFREAIIDGQMRPGQRVPSTRNLAAELKISRSPVLHAYEQLLAEGYFETFVGVGTCVPSSIPDDVSAFAEARPWWAVWRATEIGAHVRNSRQKEAAGAAD